MKLDKPHLSWIYGPWLQLFCYTVLGLNYNQVTTFNSFNGYPQYSIHFICLAVMLHKSHVSYSSHFHLISRQHDHDSSYTTISEHSTTDTSIIDISDSSEFTEDSWLPSPNFNILQTLKRRIWNSYLSSNDTDDESLDTNDDSAMEEYSFSSTVDSSTEFETLNASSDSYDVGSDLDTNTEWDVTSSSLGIPEDVQGLMSQIFVNTSEMFNLILNSSGSCVK